MSINGVSTEGLQHNQVIQMLMIFYVMYLQVGDKILSINGVSTEGLQHNQVIQMLKSAEDSVTLQLTQGILNSQFY